MWESYRFSRSCTVSGIGSPCVSGSLALSAPEATMAPPKSRKCRLGEKSLSLTRKGARMPPRRAATETRPMAVLRMEVGKTSPEWM